MYPDMVGQTAGSGGCVFTVLTFKYCLIFLVSLRWHLDGVLVYVITIKMENKNNEKSLSCNLIKGCGTLSFFLSPVATKLWKGDIGLPFVRPSVL